MSNNHLKLRPNVAAASIILTAIGAGAVWAATQQDQWGIHDMKRPQPRPVATTACCAAPADAVVLFDGKDAAAWQKAGSNGEAAGWEVIDGNLCVKPGTGDIATRQSFGDCQLHMEWMVPTDLHCRGQHGCNSGVFFMNQYEVQVLNSNGNETYADGMAASLYGQNPPLVNACKPQGEWNSYDIVFHGPRFADDGQLLHPATATVFMNGVLVQDHFTLWGSTAHGARAKYSAHPDQLPIRLQDHGDPLKFRNIWLRPLTAADGT